MSFHSIIELLKTHLPWIESILSILEVARRLFIKTPKELPAKSTNEIINLTITAAVVHITNNVTNYQVHLPQNWNTMATAITLGSACGLLIQLPGQVQSIPYPTSCTSLTSNEVTTATAGTKP